MGGQLLAFNPAVNGVGRHAQVTGDFVDGIPAGLGRSFAGFDLFHSVIVTESRNGYTPASPESGGTGEAATRPVTDLTYT